MRMLHVTLFAVLAAVAVTGCTKTLKGRQLSEYCAIEGNADKDLCAVNGEIQKTRDALAVTDKTANEAKSMAASAQSAANAAQATATEANSKTVNCTTSKLNRVKSGSCAAAPVWARERWVASTTMPVATRRWTVNRRLNKTWKTEQSASSRSMAAPGASTSTSWLCCCGKVSSGGSDEIEATLPRLSVRECLHYTLSVDPDVALLGLSFPNEQDAAFAAFSEFLHPLSARELADLSCRAAEARKDKGPCWWNPDPHV